MAEHEGKTSSNKENAEAMRRKRIAADIMLDESKEAAEIPDPYGLLLGQVISQPSIEKHAALLSDNRLSYPANAGQKARFVLQLQQSYGNKYVQRVVDLVQAKRQDEFYKQKLNTVTGYDTIAQSGQDRSHETTTVSQEVRTYQNTLETEEELPAQEATAIGTRSHLIQAQPKEGAEKPKTEQSIYRFEVCFVFDPLGRAKLTVGRAEEKADIGAKKVKPKVKPQEITSYGYSHGFYWAWESSAEWESGKLVKVEEAAEGARKAIKSAHDSIDNSSLDENERKAAHDDLDFIDLQISFFFNITAMVSRKPVISEGDPDAARKAEEESYKSGMNTGPFTSIEFLEDKITYKLAGGGPVQKPEEAKLDIMNPIVVDQFEFNKFGLPTQGEGVKHLMKLCNLPASIKAEIVIKRITGHTDKVPVRRPGRRFATLEELSMKRIQPVIKLLQGAKFAPLPPGEALGDKEAKYDAKESDEVRAADRKVVVEWERKKSP